MRDLRDELAEMVRRVLGNEERRKGMERLADLRARLGKREPGVDAP